LTLLSLFHDGHSSLLNAERRIRIAARWRGTRFCLHTRALHRGKRYSRQKQPQHAEASHPGRRQRSHLRAAIARAPMAAGYGVEVTENLRRAREAAADADSALAIVAPE
jgi:hypothetical protein